MLHHWLVVRVCEPRVHPSAPHSPANLHGQHNRVCLLFESIVITKSQNRAAAVDLSTALQGTERLGANTNWPRGITPLFLGVLKMLTLFDSDYQNLSSGGCVGLGWSMLPQIEVGRKVTERMPVATVKNHNLES